MNSGPVPLYEWRSALKYASDSENEELVNALKKRPQELFEEELCEAAKWGNAKKLAKYIQSSGLTEKLRERAILAALEVVPEAIEEVLELLSVKLLSSKLRKILILKLLRGYVGARSVALFILRSAPLEENEYEEIEKAISELPIADKEERDKKALQEMLEIINKLKNK